ncbi:MAG: hypothetical protein CO132_02115 [Candidatus Kerfeldbacteria bacterium CG_4_9_14_3_um_filter_45_8]|nr:MAG: hypothetical protein CO132_02115 [Candidatus Kerfeldbacteria bacterium CG_4_9_14_3_um_filter_45_8]
MVIILVSTEMQTTPSSSSDPQDIFEAESPISSRQATSGNPETQDIEKGQAFFFEDLDSILSTSIQYIEESIADFTGTEKEQFALEVQVLLTETRKMLRDIQAKYYESCGTVKNALQEDVKIFLREYDKRAFDKFVPKYGESVRKFNEYVAYHLAISEAN